MMGQMGDRLKVQSCQRKEAGTWTCFAYLVGNKGHIRDRSIVGLNHEGSQWTLDRSLTHLENEPS